METRLTWIQVRLRNRFAHAVMASLLVILDESIWWYLGVFWISLEVDHFVMVWWCAGLWQIGTMNLWDKMSTVSQICLIFVSNCLNRSKICLKHVSDKMSQFGLNLRPFWHLRHNWDCPYLRAIWDIFPVLSKRCQNMSQKGIWGI